MLGLAILPIGWLIARILKTIARRVMKEASIDPTLTGFAANLLYVTLLVFVVITALGTMGVPTASFAAVVGAAGLAVGLALKGTLGNFAAGVVLILFRPFKVGDRIEAAGVCGTVEEIKIFATTLKAEDDTKVIIPNASITGGKITNFPAH